MKNQPELRPYQQQLIADFDAARAAGKRRIILVAPTGSGKTVVAAEVIRREVAAFRDVLIFSHRREITKHTSKKFFDHGISHGIIQAGFLPSPLERVQLASVQTLHRRAIASDTMQLPPAKTVIVDEAHRIVAESYQDIIREYPDATLIGLTATPCRGDGRGLGGVFELMIETPQIGELIAQKYLVGTRVYAPIIPDLTGVRTQAGDYVENQLAERMDRPQLVGDIVSHWHRYGERRKTVCFATSVGHSIHIAEEFVKSGVRAEHIDGSTPKDERDATLARLASGEIDVVTNCQVLTEGWNLPEVACCILARPTKKMGLYRQMGGRVLRPAPGKSDAIILDHSGAVYRHGFLEDRVDWTLDPDRRAKAPKHEARGSNGASSRLVECKICGAIRVSGQPCFHCGYMPAPPPRAVEFIDGDLGPVDRHSRQAKADLSDPRVRAQWHAMLAHIADERGYQSGWIAHKYREKFNTWPPWGSRPDPIPPSPEVRSWVRSRMIAYAKRRGAA